MGDQSNREQRGEEFSPGLGIGEAGRGVSQLGSPGNQTFLPTNSRCVQTVNPLKVELGGGRRPKGDGFINVDILECPEVDIKCDFNLVGALECRLPFRSNSVSDLYSSHCLEHISVYQGLLHEIARVCVLGARVEIRVPHWNSDMAAAAGHCHVVSETVVDHWQRYADDWWTGEKMMMLVKTTHVPSKHFARARLLHPLWSNADIYRYLSGTCHEIRFFFQVVEKLA